MRAPAQTMRLARQLRRKLSPPEARLWRVLRLRGPGLPVFRRQHPIGPYVLDFYCAKARLQSRSMVRAMACDATGRSAMPPAMHGSANKE